MTGYVLDDLALSAGLTGTGDEHHRREFSRLISRVTPGRAAGLASAACAATLLPAAGRGSSKADGSTADLRQAGVDSEPTYAM